MLKINFYTIYRSITGERAIEMDIEEGSSLSDCLHTLFEMHPKLEAEFLETDGENVGEIREYVSIFISGEEMRVLDNLDTKLSNTDIIDIIPPVEGG